MMYARAAATTSTRSTPTPPRRVRPGRPLSKSSTRCFSRPLAKKQKPSSEGFEGWDDYAPFYDWENARTLGRRDVPFWRNLALNAGGPVLELGCGTGRIAIPLGRAGAHVIGIDRSDAMLARARARLRRSRFAG